MPARFLGPSPRVRGKPLNRPRPDRGELCRSIPARAGETVSTWIMDEFGSPGPSPRVRGKRPAPTRRIGCSAGSIPARAGETPASTATQEGPSPRVRGKRCRRPPHDVFEGSIPARAGETYCRPCGAGCPPVHPRACGGNRTMGGLPAGTWGPSPRVRGKPLHRRRPDDALRSIPARAGETVLTCIMDSRGPSPRVRGKHAVLSPRVRGKRLDQNSSQGACGGNADQGPSPRVRGKPHARDRAPEGRGSIPARAGETTRRSPTWCASRVHPRACGGNISSTTD